MFYPSEWHGDPESLAAEMSALEAVDPRVEVVIERYLEPEDLRSARGRPHDAALRDLAPPLSDAQRQAFARVEVAVTVDLPFDVATVAPRLRWVQAVGAGTGQLQSAGLTDAGIRLTTNGGSNSIGIAEFAFGRLLAVQKRFRELDARQDQHRWKAATGKQVAGQTLGLLGYGPINQAVAARAAAFGMRILVTRRTAGVEAEPPVERFYTVSDLHEMLSASDAVIAAVPETRETIDLLDRDAFAAMQPGAFFCNVGRGSLLDEAALIDALQSGALGAAALDVTRTEPLPPDDPLWDAPNLYLSPHCSTSGSAMLPKLHRLVRDNLRRYLAGESLAHEFDPDRGY